MRESYQNALAAGIEKRFQNLEYEVMEDIVRRIQKAGKITSTADWELHRMQILGKSTADLRKIIASAVQFDDDEVERLYREVVDNEYTVYKDQYLKINRKFIPYDENKELQQITKALTQQSNEDLNNITKSMGFMVRNATGKLEFTPLGEKYNEYLDQAITDMTSGVYDYNTLVRRLVKQMTNSGLRTERQFAENAEDMSGVDYPSGWHNRIDVAARRALLTGFSQITGQIMDMNAEALHVDRFEVSWHMGARPEHAAWQGKVYTKQQLIDICGLGTGPGLLGWNCRHEYYLFFPGSQRTYTDEWLAKQNAKEAETTTFRGREYNTYQATQKQRQLETRMRAQRETVKLMEAAEADSDDITIEKCKYQAQMDEYRDFSRTMGLKTQMERVYGDLKGKVAPSKKQYQEYKQEKEKKHQEWLHSIGADGTTLKTVAEYEEAKYNKTREYILLKGYAKAVSKGDISVLVGFDVYRQTADEVEKKIIGMETSDGIKIESYATHFIDRVIGQTSTSHPGMRMGVPVDDAYKALKTGKPTQEKKMKSGDVRKMYFGNSCSVVISVTDSRLIQTNPRGEN